MVELGCVVPYVFGHEPWMRDTSESGLDIQEKMEVEEQGCTGV